MHRLINATKVAESGHHAIIPTGTAPQGLSENESKVYDLIVRRLCAALMPDGQDERTTVITTVGTETFRTQGTTVIAAGWRSVLTPLTAGHGKKDEDNQAVPPGLQKGQTVTVQQSDILEKLTKALPALNDASLLALMEKYGLGTPATSARILEVLETRGFIQRQKKSLVSTAKGQALLAVVPDSVKDPALTGQWEAQLEEIAQGKKGPETFLAEIRAYTQQIVSEAQAQQSAVIGTDLGDCPVCHQGRIIPGKKAYGCSRWREGCKFVIWREMAGKKLSESQVKALLAGKTTAEVKGFTSKAGKPFSAKLHMVENQVKFVFDAPQQAQGPRKRA
jgi:DNA topoisomerase-3